jgi:hypothetical protein
MTSVQNELENNMHKIWYYLKKEIWEDDDLKFDFWYRIQNHQILIFELLNKKGIKSNNILIDNSERLKEEIKQKYDNVIPYRQTEYNLDW